MCISDGESNGVKVFCLSIDIAHVQFYEGNKTAFVDMCNDAFKRPVPDRLSKALSRPAFEVIDRLDSFRTSIPPVVSRFSLWIESIVRLSMQLIRHWSLELVFALCDMRASGRHAFAALYPWNIAITLNGWLVIASLGIVRLEDYVRSCTYSTFVAEFTAPEVKKKPAFSIQSNWYSIGVILYRLVFGIFPESAGDGSARKGHEGRFTTAEDRKLVAQFHAMVKRLLEPEPKRRYEYALFECEDDPFFAEVSPDKGRKMRDPDGPAS